MQLAGGTASGGSSTVIYSATDLSAASACEWALLRKLDWMLGRIEKPPFVEDDMLKRAGRLGDLHEKKVLDSLKLTRTVAEIERPEDSGIRDGSFAGIRSATADTIAALNARADVVFQGAFFDGRFLGYSDFVILGENGLYEVYDTKLARKAKITALLQLAAYSDQLQALGFEVGENVHLWLGTGEISTHRLADILPVYHKRRARLQQILDDRVTDSGATKWGDPRYSACGRCDACAEQVERTHDVLQVAGMRLTQRAKLRAAGVLTTEQLAVRVEPVQGMSDATLAALRDQASMQVQAAQVEAAQVDAGSAPPWRVVNPIALTALPAPDAGDVFFDFEGDPLHEEQQLWGLDYLFGMVDTDAVFTAFWADSLAEEKVALVRFLEFVRERRAAHPGMHIYHYASYERTHLLTLAARHGVGEEEIDDLLRNTVLVDLYPIVRQGLRIGSHSYSLKKLEPLYMEEGRDGTANAADSISEYVRYTEFLATGEADAAAAVRADIEQYNTYDCVSTLRLRDWLLARASEVGVTPAVDDALAVEMLAAMPLREPDPVYTALMGYLQATGGGADGAGGLGAERGPDETAIALASAAIDYHRREAKSFWWEHFDRLRSPVDEWADTRGVFVIDSARVVRDWSLEGPRARNLSREFVVTGTAAPGSRFTGGDSPFVLFDPPFPPLVGRFEPGTRLAHSRVTFRDRGDGTYSLTEKLSSDGETYDEVPLAVTPASPPGAAKLAEAIAEWGREVLAGLRPGGLLPGGLLPGDPRTPATMIPDAALDILRREPPRLVSLPGLVRGESTIASIRSSLLDLHRSYIAVQGPPGTGKTYTGSHVIADLVANHGWKVGVVAQSHSAVENMLEAIVAAGLDPKLVGKKLKDSDARPGSFTALTAGEVAGFVGQSNGYVFGGTQWTFANANTVPRGSLDLLVIDEAGQFSLASTIASSVAASRLLLLGDPQQLPQVSQGTHPEPVDVSALGWLASGHGVLPEPFGYFLDTSWRMHPALCAPVSRLSYEGRLFSHDSDRMLMGVDPGLHVLPIAHRGNSTASIEETAAVVELIDGLLGSAWSAEGVTRPLGERDLIVVAPYNAQVELIGLALAAAGHPDVPVGTVDRFQGQEAAIAIISLAASGADDVPRGLEFLLLANRLNVAISRAQWASYLVFSPALTEYLPGSVAGLTQLSAFIDLVEPGAAAPGAAEPRPAERRPVNGSVES
ncbi:TM0106 family RecB-like putative nuclease [Subtercola boreus]|uniref:TM0106 family RecB-like putative nuclease n=1 Tax=Subtercola boreus TaxID=120213 RepID=UPI00209BF614|nr:bifunctional RecB family nuclease/DEAD/DEAH box helicase [Subtercola boreus]